MTATTWARLTRSILCPQYAVRQIVRRLSIGSLDFRLAMGALDRPHYAFGVNRAIYLASKLQQPKVSVIEFGVAEGKGLLVLERYAAELGRRAGIEVEVYGFDTGHGLPAATADYRDLRYVWKQGAYRMDIAALKSRLKFAKLVLGNVEETVPEFARAGHAPIGFISFDLDYYSATAAAFQIFAGPDSSILPRVICYFDDVVSDGHQLHCDNVGELLAIREFNESQDGRRFHTLAPMGLLNSNVMFPGLWAQQLWVYHRFQHCEYNTYIGM